MFNSGRRGKRSADGYGIISQAEKFIQLDYPVPTVTGFTVTDVSYNPLDDQALSTTGGQTVVINGSGFNVGASVAIGATTIGAVNFINENKLSFVTPALTSADYTIFVTNTNGAMGILIGGFPYSGVPSWSSPSSGSLGTVFETTPVSQSFVATGDETVTYSLLSGTLPPGSTLAANGVLSGTSDANAGTTTYSFTIRATDAQQQDSDRSFTITITSDVVTWITPESDSTIYLVANSVMSNIVLSSTSAAGYGIQYSANALPTGVSISDNIIYGTPTVSNTLPSAITATSNTSSRTAVRYINWVVNLSDSFYRNVVTLINGETYYDEFSYDYGANNLITTVYGDTRPSKFTPFSDGYYSYSFDGTGDYITFPVTGIANFGTNNFTIEAWVYVTAAPDATYGSYIFDARDSGNPTSACTLFLAGAAGQITFYAGTSYYSSGTNITLNKWQHIAVVRQGSDLSIFLDGSRIYNTPSYAYNHGATTSTGYIGCRYTTAQGLISGYISNLRVSKGSAYYDATQTSVTAPTTPLVPLANTVLLTCKSARIIETSNSALTLTVNGDIRPMKTHPFTVDENYPYLSYGSAYFDGTGDYTGATFPADNGPIFTGDLTAECWVYPTGSESSYIFLYGAPQEAYYTEDAVALTKTGGSVWVAGTQYSANFANNATIPGNTWSHIALVRSANTITAYLNGSPGTGVSAPGKIESTSTRWDLADSLGFWLGKNISNWTQQTFIYYKGYISNVRLVGGNALYTSSFTPPVDKLTAIANTEYLSCQSIGVSHSNKVVRDNGPFDLTIESRSNAYQSTFSPYSQIGWSAQLSTVFNQHSIVVPASTTALNGVATDFTVEFWGMRTSLSSFNTVASLNSSGSVVCRMNSVDGTMSVMGASTSAAEIDNRVFAAPGKWFHMAISRQSGIAYLHVNGVQIKSWAYLDAPHFSGTLAYIGNYNNNSGQEWVGYLSNYRVVTGSAVYAKDSTFIPPTETLSAITGTQLLLFTSGSFTDKSTNQVELTITNTPSMQPVSPFNVNVPYKPTTNGGSVYFSGTDSYLAIVNTPLLDGIVMGADDYTLEFWVYPTAAISSTVCFYTADQNNYYLGYDPASGIITGISGSSTITGTYATTLKLRCWTHIAISRESGSSRCFINGKQVGSTVTDTNSYGRLNVSIGAQYNVTQLYVGFMSDLRMTRRAIYTTQFVPPSSALKAINSTTLLISGDNAGVVDQSGKTWFNIVSGTAVQTNPKYKKYGKKSVNLNNRYMYNNYSNPNLILGSGNFTVECWIYWVDSNNNGGIFNLATASGGTQGLDLHTYYNTGYIYCAGSARSFGTITTGVWKHYAIVRSSGSTKLYVDGVYNTTMGTITDTTNYVTPYLFLGCYQSLLTTYAYLDDLRITRGEARYTADFTPPTYGNIGL